MDDDDDNDDIDDNDDNDELVGVVEKDGLPVGDDENLIY